MPYEAGDITKELTIALINKINAPLSKDRLAHAKWVGDVYKTIYKAVTKPTEPIENEEC
jgi:hypothetical protein